MSGTFTNLLFHVTFSTKLRRPWIRPELETELLRYMGGIIRGEGGILLEINGVPDHVHLLVKLKPTATLSGFLAKVKANSSKWVNQNKSRIYKFRWQDGYGAFTVSESQVPRVRTYIRDQKEHHKTFDFKTEFLTLLQRHGVKYDERYVFD